MAGSMHACRLRGPQLHLPIKGCKLLRPRTPLSTLPTVPFPVNNKDNLFNFTKQGNIRIPITVHTRHSLCTFTNQRKVILGQTIRGVGAHLDCGRADRGMELGHAGRAVWGPGCF